MIHYTKLTNDERKDRYVIAIVGNVYDTLIEQGYRIRECSIIYQYQRPEYQGVRYMNIEGFMTLDHSMKKNGSLILIQKRYQITGEYVIEHAQITGTFAYHRINEYSCFEQKFDIDFWANAGFALTQTSLIKVQLSRFIHDHADMRSPWWKDTSYAANTLNEQGYPVWLDSFLETYCPEDTYPCGTSIN